MAIRICGFIISLLFVGLSPLLPAAEIHEAAKAGDLARVQALLKEEPTLLQARDKRDSTPLHFAADGGHLEIVEFLVESGADLSARDVDGDTPLHWAAYAGRTSTTALFLAKGADLDARNIQKATPLHYAVLGEKTRVIYLLLDGGADINARNYEGEAPLHMAVLRNQRKMARLLLDRGADLKLGNNHGRTPLLLAARETGSVPMARFLLEQGADLNARDKSQATPIILAAWRGFQDQVDLFLDQGAEVEVDGEAGKQMILYATGRKLDRLFEYLVKKGADLNLPSDRGGSLLHDGAAGGSTRIVSRLLELGLSVGQHDRYGWTPLHYAAYRNRLPVAKLLLAAGAELDARTLSGRTPACLAQKLGRTEVLNFLIDEGADKELERFPVLEGPYMGQKEPGDRPQVFALDMVSTTDGEHGCITFSPDGTEAYWSSFLIIEDSGYSHCHILSSHLVEGRWTAPAPASFTRDGDNRADVPFYAPDGKRIYFSSRSPLKSGGRPGKENLWFAEKRNGAWEDPRPLSQAVNRLDVHWQISVTRDYTLYFGAGELGICRSAYVDGEYGEPEPVGNKAGDDFSGGSPYVAPDESYLLFKSNRGEAPGNRGGLYITFKDDKGEWTRPLYAGGPIEEASGSICHQVSHDGKYLFFLSSSKGRSNVYWVKADFIAALRAEVLGGS